MTVNVCTFSVSIRAHLEQTMEKLSVKISIMDT